MSITERQALEVLLNYAEVSLLWHVNMCNKLHVRDVQGDKYFSHFTNKVTGTTADIWEIQKVMRDHPKGENLMSVSQRARWIKLLDTAVELGFWL